MTDIRSEMISFILSKTPVNFGGKDDWLGVKMSPHQPFEFINKIGKGGIETSVTKYSWDECHNEVIQTIYQRLKLKNINMEQITEEQLSSYHRMKELVEELTELIFEMPDKDRADSIEYIKSQLDEIR